MTGSDISNSSKGKVRLSTLRKYTNLGGLDKYEKELLAGWEEVYKKGQLTLWIMLALKDAPRHMAQIKKFIDTQTNKTLWADDKSMYRALRRFESAELVGYSLRPSNSGPDLKVYHLTDTGRKVLEHFVHRNIVSIFYNEQVKELLR